MNGMGLGRRVWNSVPRTVVAICIGVMSGAGAEVETVAYHVDRAGFAGIVDGRGPDSDDPFSGAPDRVGTVETPFLLQTPPGKTRFLRKGDRMWMMTKQLWEAGVFEEESSWAVWNEETNRLVVRGTLWEQVLAERVCRSLDAPALIGTELELMRVPCREFGMVSWSAAEVRKRGGARVGIMEMTGRPGAKTLAELAMPGGTGRLEVEAQAGSEDSIVDMRVKYSVPVFHRDGVRRLDLDTGLAVFAGHEVFHELGGSDDAATTYVLRVKAVPRFIDGTPRWRWREAEDEVLTKAPTVPDFYSLVRTELEGGLVLSRVAVHATFIEAIEGGDGTGGDGDPFAPDPGLAKRDDVGWKFPRVVPPDDLPGCRKSDVVFDVRRALEDAGLRVPEGGWIYFNRSRAFLSAKLDASNADLLEALVCGVLYDPPKLIRTTVSLIAWEGELEPGTMPAGARRLARAAMVSRPGQQVTMRHGWPGEELKRGMELELETGIGANNRIVDMRLFAEVAGERRVRVSTGMTLEAGSPVVVPVGAEGGTRWGLVLDCRIIDATGRD